MSIICSLHMTAWFSTNQTQRSGVDCTTSLVHMNLLLASTSTMRRPPYSSVATPNKKHQLAILELAGVKAFGTFDKYHGLPSYVRRNKQKAVSLVLDRIKSKVSNWKTNMLSQGGKEILLKSMLRAIPTYSMGIFQLPKVILRRINKLLQSFWWGQKENKSKNHWISWKSLGKPKHGGGLDSGILNNLILPYLPNKDGDSSKTNLPLLPRCSKPNIILTQTSS